MTQQSRAAVDSDHLGTTRQEFGRVVPGPAADPGDGADLPADMRVIDHESALEAGLALILNGLVHRAGV
ncbi:hypothetical protein [Streptomyces sp. NPDC001508]|uniref:hypothetical protein n=1 Tax=Streptomyces sp. NPDC001508 TaxID=3154656 RepID=UPI00332C77DB